MGYGVNYFNSMFALIKRLDTLNIYVMKKSGLVLILMLITLSIATFTSCGKTETATITRVYQKLVSGPVNTYISVEFENGETAEVVLPIDDKIWNIARNSKGKQVKVKKSGDKWVFVDFTSK